MLLKEFLEPLGVSQVEAAARMNTPFQRLNAIIKARRAVIADTALLLEALTGWDAQIWLALPTLLRRLRMQDVWPDCHAPSNLLCSLAATRGAYSMWPLVLATSAMLTARNLELPFSENLARWRARRHQSFRQTPQPPNGEVNCGSPNVSGCAT
jgi:addiction module HigA family antidote